MCKVIAEGDPDDVEDPNNSWSKLNELIIKQESIIKQMENLNNDAIKNNNGGSTQNPTSSIDVSSLAKQSGVSLLKAEHTVEILSDLSKDSERETSTAESITAP